VNDNLPVHEDKNKGVFVKGLQEVFVGSVEEVHALILKGNSARVVASTSII
jgi:kinesin family protein 5